MKTIKKSTAVALYVTALSFSAYAWYLDFLYPMRYLWEQRTFEVFGLPWIAVGCICTAASLTWSPRMIARSIYRISQRLVWKNGRRQQDMLQAAA